MRKAQFEVQLPFSILKEGDQYIAHTPALDLSTSAKSFGEVRRRFVEVVGVFLEELQEKGTLDQVLSDLGWVKLHKQWTPPVLVAHESEKVALPISN